MKPFADFSLTHGICGLCKAKGLSILDREIEHSKRLSECQYKLYDAGRTGDLEAAEDIIHRALSFGLRPVDIMIRLIAPMLYAIGDAWERGTVSVAIEHQFTAFSEKVFDALNSRRNGSEQTTGEGTGPKILMLNAYENTHTLGIRILAMYLKRLGFDARVLSESISTPEVLAECQALRPAAVLISLALVEQRPHVASVTESLAASAGCKPPLIAVGGYAIKMGLVRPIPGTRFVTYITDLVDLLRQLPNEGTSTT